MTIDLAAENLSTRKIQQATPEPVLVVQNLSVVFRDASGSLHALDNLSFSVYPEEFVCILGPSGSGKSTLLRVLAGLLPPSHGGVYYTGEPIDKPQFSVGYVFQKGQFDAVALCSGKHHPPLGAAKDAPFGGPQQGSGVD